MTTITLYGVVNGKIAKTHQSAEVEYFVGYFSGTHKVVITRDGDYLVVKKFERNNRKPLWACRLAKASTYKHAGIIKGKKVKVHLKKVKGTFEFTDD